MTSASEAGAIISISGSIGSVRDIVGGDKIGLDEDGVRQVIREELSASQELSAQARGMAEALERDFARRYALAMQRSMFPELSNLDLLRNLADEVLDGNITTLSPGLRRTILLRAARSAALRKAVGEAATFLAAGTQLPGEDRELPAKARLTEARGDVDGAVQMLRDERDADSWSVLLSLLSQHKGDIVAITWFSDATLATRD